MLIIANGYDGLPRHYLETSVIPRLMQNMTLAHNGCWEWGGTRDKDGYGVICTSVIKQANPRVHRLVYAMTSGADITGKLVCHACDNPPCFNPEHLWLGTIRENNGDRARKGRGYDPRGMASHTAKLTDEDVLLIREAVDAGAEQKEVAVAFNVSRALVCLIVRRKVWTHI